MKNKILIYRIIQIILLISYIGLLVFYTIKSLETGLQSSASSDKISDITADIIENVTQKPVEKTESFKTSVRKYIGHYSYFVALGFISSLLYFSIKELKLKYRYIIHFSTGLIYALMTEFWFQAVSSGRGPNINDVGLDYLGFSTLSFILSIILLIYYYKRNIKFKYNNLIYRYR